MWHHTTVFRTVDKRFERRKHSYRRHERRGLPQVSYANLKLRSRPLQSTCGHLYFNHAHAAPIKNIYVQTHTQLQLHLLYEWKHCKNSFKPTGKARFCHAHAALTLQNTQPPLKNIHIHKQVHTLQLFAPRALSPSTHELIDHSNSYKPPGAAEIEFDDEDDMAASCLVSLIEAAKEQNAARRRSTPSVVGSRASSRLTAQRASVLAPLSVPAGSSPSSCSVCSWMPSAWIEGWDACKEISPLWLVEVF